MSRASQSLRAKWLLQPSLWCAGRTISIGASGLPRGTPAAIGGAMDRTPRATDSSGLLLGDFGVGSRIGEYIVESRMATRGTGHVYEAIHAVLPRRVTIKVMPAAQQWVKAIALELLR